MNLIELYDTLSLPDSDEKVFTAIQIPEYPNFRVAIDIEGNPIILLSVSNAINNIALKNFRLKYLQLEQNVECKISENGKSSFQTFTVITFTSADRNLQEYFLRISETLVKTLSNKPTQQQIIESLNKFVEVFRALTDTPTNTVHGLWTELFLIANSKNPHNLLNYWHNIPEEKFDFNSGDEKIEVKSSSNFERQHIFSSEQLNPSNGIVLIASIFIKQHINGISIQQLVDNINLKIKFDITLVEKLNNVICKTLGNSLEQSIGIKFDPQLAQSSLKFYNTLDIQKIEEYNIPKEVSELRYKSDLSNIQNINLELLPNKKELFKNL
jgi:Putative  PD-(D/E)XK family member, (DUF4420)